MDLAVFDFSRFFAQASARWEFVGLQNSRSVAWDDELVGVGLVLAGQLRVDLIQSVVLNGVTVAVLQRSPRSADDAVLVRNRVQRPQLLFSGFALIIEINENN